MEGITSQDNLSTFVSQSVSLSTRSALLSQEFLNAFVNELNRSEIVGIGVGGSHVRGEATPFSDVDLLRFYSDVLVPPQKEYMYRNKRLVGIASRTVAGVRRDFTKPEIAIYAVPMMRELCILLDKNGTLRELQQEAIDFRWEDIQQAANTYVNDVMMRNTEEVYKLLSILSRDDALAFVSAMTTFPVHLTRTVAIQRGILITTDHYCYRQIHEAIGLTSPWTLAHILAVSVEPGPIGVSPLQWRGSALLVLYQETARLLLPYMSCANRKIIEQTMQVISATDFILN